MSVRSLRYNTIEQHFTKGVTASTDRDALAFLEAAQIYNANQQRAIVNLVRSLKRVGLWSKMKAIYPFVGGTATSHMYNLKDPRDADAAFRLTFSGGWTHASTGATPNGTNAYADTFLKPFAQMNASSYHQSFYSKTNSDGVYADMLGANASISEMVSLYLRLSNTIYADAGLYTSSRISATNTDSKGFYISTRTSSTSFRLRKNATQIGSNTTTDTTNFPNFNVFVGAANIGGSSTIQYSNRECAFATIGDGLTDTDATNLYNIVDLYQKRLGRAV